MSEEGGALTPLDAGAEQPVRRVTVAEWFNYLQRRLGRLDAGMDALQSILTPCQGLELNQAMARWDSKFPEFANATKPPGSPFGPNDGKDVA